MVALDRVPAVMLILLVIAVVGVATFLAIDGLQAELVQNSSGDNASQAIEQGIENIFDLAPTWGTLIGVSVLLIIVAGLAAVGFVGFNAGRDKGFF